MSNKLFENAGLRLRTDQCHSANSMLLSDGLSIFHYGIYFSEVPWDMNW